MGFKDIGALDFEFRPSDVWLLNFGLKGQRRIAPHRVNPNRTPQPTHPPSGVSPPWVAPLPRRPGLWRGRRPASAAARNKAFV